MVNSNISIIIQARMGSSRLPGKVLSEVLPGRTLLSCMLERVRRSKLATKIIVATSDREQDEAVAREAEASGCAAFRGDEADVLARFVAAARSFNSDVVVRLCADSPLHDATIIDACIEKYLSCSREVDYVSNLTPETFPYGTAVEVFPLDVLLRLSRFAQEADLREHVTSFVHRNPALFRVMNVAHHEDLSRLRFAVDYPADFEFVKNMYERLYVKNVAFSWLDVVACIETESAASRLAGNIPN